MAFESQLAVQRGFTAQRVGGEAFMLRVYETKQKGKAGQINLTVRIPYSVFKEAGFEGQKLDLFYDHENHKVMIAPSAGGVTFTVQREKSAYRDFVFAKGFTPDFGGGLIVTDHTFTKHGDAKGIVFDYDPLTMVTGRNALKEGELPTRAQAFAAALVQQENKLREAAKGTIATLPTASPSPAAAPALELQSSAIMVKPGAGEGTRRTFTTDEKKAMVRSYLQLKLNHGKTNEEAARQIGVNPSVLYRWYAQLGKPIERELKRGANAEKNRHANGAASAAHVAKQGVKRKPSASVVRH